MQATGWNIELNMDFPENCSDRERLILILMRLVLLGKVTLLVTPPSLILLVLHTIYSQVTCNDTVSGITCAVCTIYRQSDTRQYVVANHTVILYR